MRFKLEARYDFRFMEVGTSKLKLGSFPSLVCIGCHELGENCSFRVKSELKKGYHHTCLRLATRLFILLELDADEQYSLICLLA